MTKNNLNGYLKWLVKQGPSLYPSLTSAREIQNTSTSQRHSDQRGDVDIRDSQNIFSEVESDANMARLLFAPQSTNKPRMLSSSKGPVTNTPKRNIPALVESPTEQRGTQLQTVVRGSQSRPSPLRKTGRPVATPLQQTRAFDLTSPLLDIDAVDLTGDFDHTTPSSGTIEEFGEPHQIWTEEAAFRKGPTEKRGTKRKSDEYISDLVSPRRDAPKIRSPDRPHSGRDRFSQPSHSRSNSQPVKDDDTPSPTKHRDNKSSIPQRSRLDRVIADSDDDHSADDNIFDKWIDDEEDPVLATDEAEVLYPDLPQEIPADNSEMDNSFKRATRSSSPFPKTTNAVLEEKQSFTQGPVSEKHSFAQETSHISSPPKVPSSQPKDKDIVSFLALSADSLDQLVARLKATITKNSEIVYQQAMRGEQAPGLISENKTLAYRIEAIDLLKKEKVAYQACELKRETLKKDLIRFISQGGDPQSMPKEIAQSRDISSKLEQIEENIHDLLRRAGIESSILNSSNPGNSQHGPEKSHSSPRARSTRPSEVRDDICPRSPRSRRITTDSVFVSPAPGRKTFDYSTSRTEIATRTSGTLSRTSHGSTKPGVFDYDEPMVSDEEDAFTRTMGSPPRSFEELDEFDLDADDVEMLEAVGHFDGGREVTSNTYESQNRKVFAETSGNTSCIPSPQKSQNHNSLWHQHPWSKDVKSVLKERFNLRGFRVNQLEAIDSTLSGKDTFVLMPTGGGKSLCYQLPSVVTSGSNRGVTIVISPLLSLMQDQVSHLKRLKIKAFVLNGETKTDERQWINRTLSGPAAEENIELLYITPEMINKSQTITRNLEKLNRNRRLARIVIDEAHCVSQWGHDFRPDYKALGELRAQLPGVPMMALTATATENVKVDVIHNLKMEGCAIFSQSFNRPNLTYEVRPKKKGGELLTSIADTIRTSYQNKSGIVYCLSRKTCETVAKALAEDHNIKADHYHAGMDSIERAKVQEAWQSGRTHVIVATIAFGMGIDKPDVRFVIHHSIPKSLEGYYQETGRAGRDGKRSGCYLYYSYADTTTISSMIEKGEGSKQQKNRQRQMLQNVVQFCENKSDCRRVQILAYFNEYFRREDCNSSCDNCKSDAVFELRDFSQHASSAVKIVQYFEDQREKVTMSYCVNMFRGSVKKFRSPQHKQAPCFGDGSDLEMGEAERLFHRLLGEGALLEENVINGNKFAIQYIKLGRRASDFQNGRRRLQLHVRVSPNGKSRATAPKSRIQGRKDDHPQSTNVSSPIHSANERRLARFQYQDSSDSERDSDGFERIRVAGKPRREGGHTPGPPITADHRFDNLDLLHKAVAEDFMVYAKQLCQQLVLEKGLRNQPFSDSILREMVIVFPKDLAELAAIPGIDPDKAKRYGTRMLKLLKSAQRRYEKMTEERDDADGVVPDPNHHNVINLSSDEEYSCNDDLFMDEMATLEPENNVISSRFFTTQPTLESDTDEDEDIQPSGSKPRKRQPTKRFRRKNATGSSSKTRAPRAPRTKKANSDNRSSNPSGPRKGSTARKTSTSAIGMMPI